MMTAFHLRRTSVALLALLMLSGEHVARAATISDACEATKQKEAGKLAQCLHLAEKQRIASGDTVKYAATVGKCTAKFSAKWQLAEDKAVAKGGACPTTGNASTVRAGIAAHVACLTSELATGTGDCVTCGNGVIDPGEDCDIGTLGGATCSSVSAGDLGWGTLACNADCTFDTSGCSSCPPDGAIVDGHCWVLGNAGASCDAACTSFGLVYDPATWTYAGSAGTDANCLAVMNALRQPATSIVSDVGPPGGNGCYWNPGSGSGGEACYRETIHPTTSTGTIFPWQRACACQ